MSPFFLIIAVLTYGLTLWLGLYLVSRDVRQPYLVLAGLGLVVYGLGVASNILLAVSSVTWGWGLTKLILALHVAPAVLWTGALIYLLPDDHPWRVHLGLAWRYGSIPLAAMTLLVANLNLAEGSDIPLSAVVLLLVVLLPMLVALAVLWRTYSAAPLANARRILAVAILFMGLGLGLALVPLNWLPRPWAFLLIGLDVLALGLMVTVLDAFAQGETVLPHIIRSFDAAVLTALIFGGQITLAMWLGAGITFPMLALLLATVGTAIATATLSDPIQSLFDRVAFARFPHLRGARADLRATASALPRVATGVNLSELDEAEFTRLVRRALSHFGDLPRLAASPLTSLPQVKARLAGSGVGDDNPIVRATHLKAILTESIRRLKPQGKGDFGTSDEWRHYNALYFPYVVGLKPYSRRTLADGYDPTSRAALDWFQSQVPERTLHNWQTAAARLIALDLRNP